MSDLLAGKKITSLQSYEESIPNVKTLQGPDWSDINFSLYFAPEPVVPLLGARGCYYNLCDFCGIPKIWKNEGEFRIKTVEQVFEEIKELYKYHGVRNFKFVEESHQLKFAIDLSTLVQESRLPLRFEAFANLEPVFRYFC